MLTTLAAKCSLMHWKECAADLRKHDEILGVYCLSWGGREKDLVEVLVYTALYQLTWVSADKELIHLLVKCVGIVSRKLVLESLER